MFPVECSDIYNKISEIAQSLMHENRWSGNETEFTSHCHGEMEKSFCWNGKSLALLGWTRTRKYNNYILHVPGLSSSRTLTVPMYSSSGLSPTWTETWMMQTCWFESVNSKNKNLTLTAYTGTCSAVCLYACTHMYSLRPCDMANITADGSCKKWSTGLSCLEIKHGTCTP